MLDLKGELKTLKVEVLVEEAKMIMKTVRNKPIYGTSMVVEKEEVVEVGRITLVLNVLSVASTTTMQMTTGWANVITMVRSIT